MQQERGSFVFISTSDSAVTRLKQASEFLNLEIKFYSGLKLFLDEDKVRPRTLLIDLRGAGDEQKDLLTKIKRMLPKTQVIGIIESEKDKKSEWVLQHYITTQMLSTFALEFLLFQRNFCEYFEISPTDLFPDSMVYFNAYHFLPLNQKYLPLVHENFKLSEKKHKRIESLKALYIFRGDSSPYAEYIEKYFDQFGVGLRKRSKARAYQLLAEWRDLLYANLFEMREIESCPLIRPDFVIWLNELLNYFTTSEDALSIIYELCKLPCFEFDRSMMEMIVSSHLSRNLGDDEAELILDLRLLLSFSRLQVDSLLYKRWYLDQKLSPEEVQSWIHYPKVLENHSFSPDYPAQVKQDLEEYQKQFLIRDGSEVNKGRLIYTYLGEIITSVMQKSTSEQYVKEDLIDTVMVKVKADGIIAESWIEELRQFLKK